MPVDESGRAIMLRRELRFCVAMVAFAAMAAVGLSAPPSDVDGADARVHQQLMQVLEECVNASGREYIDARERWLGGDGDDLQEVLAAPTWSTGAWERLLVARAIRIRLERPEECASFDAMFERLIKKSMTMSIKQNSPVTGPIIFICNETMSKDPKFEPLILERLVKYDDAPHVKQGIIVSLANTGTEESLEPLLGVLRSDRAGMPIGRCAMAIARISMRIGDTRAVDDIAAQYRVRPRRRGTGLPEEQLRLMPPFPQVDFIAALLHIGGAKAVKALEELLAAETDPPLIARLRDTHAKVRERMIKERSQNPATSDPQD